MAPKQQNEWYNRSLVHQQGYNAGKISFDEMTKLNYLVWQELFNEYLKETGTN